MPRKPDPPSASAAGSAHSTDVLIEVRDLEVHFGLRGGALSRLLGRSAGVVRAVDGVNLSLRRGEVLGLVGESGSGKTTLGRAFLGLVSPTAGTITYGSANLAELGQRQLRKVRHNLQMVFQDPHAALNPSMDLETAIGHPLIIHGIAANRAAARPKVVAALERVGLVPTEQFLTKYPSDLSGGQKQRAVLARAIILGPELLVADEPISMLDMSVRAKILELMLELKRDLELTYVYITHDLATAKFFCDRLAIMYLGRIVEIGTTEEIFSDPKHPYTKALLAAVPEPDPSQSVPRDLPRGEIPDAASPPRGCSFHPRCPRAFEQCGWETRDLRALLEQHWTTLSEDAYESERAMIGNLDDLEQPGHLAALEPRGAFAAKDVLDLVQRVRDADPAEPLWRGVVRMEVVGSTVEIEFDPGTDPALRPAGSVDVACHLYP